MTISTTTTSSPLSDTSNVTIITEPWFLLDTFQLDPTLFSNETSTSTTSMLTAFQTIMDQWLTDPQQITKTILRADLLSDTVIKSDFIKINQDTSQTNNYKIQRSVTRQLLPRRPKDSTMFQNILFYSKINSTELHVCHIPYIKSNETTSELIPVFPLPEPCTFPSFHPRVKAYQLSCYPDTNEITVSVQFLPVDFNSDQKIDQESDLFKSTKYIMSKVLVTLGKFMKGVVNGYQKRVIHDLLVPKTEYQDRYLKVKSQFQHWVTKWPETTDPSKFVFEELGIATFLDLLWGKPSSFIDLGCGNGFLTHVLCELAHEGYGIDQVSRKIWSLYPSSTTLVAETIIPISFRCDKEWLVGNHSDELTPWIPVIAALSGYDTKFMILPCCFYDFSGSKYTGTMNGQLGRYENYLLYLRFIIEQCGFYVETEALRIPSTKNIALIGRRRTYDRDDVTAATRIQSQIKPLIDQIEFQPRIPDNLKGTHTSTD